MSKYKTTIALLIIAMGGATLAGCTEAADPAVSPSPSSAATDSEVVLPSAGAERGWDFATIESQLEAVDVAADGMSAFLSSSATYEAWWEDFSPFLTAEAAYAWEFTNPQLIESGEMTSSPIVVDSPSSTLVVVDVPTEGGTWRLEMVRFVEVGVDPGPWLIHSIQPPEKTP